MIELIFVFLFVSMSVGLIPLLGIGYLVSLFLQYWYIIIIITIVGVYIVHYIHCWILKKLIFLMEQKEKKEQRKK